MVQEHLKSVQVHGLKVPSPDTGFEFSLSPTPEFLKKLFGPEPEAEGTAIEQSGPRSAELLTG